MSIISAFCMACALSTARAQAPATSSAAPAASDVANWIAELRNPNQATRGHGAESLLKAGPDAIPEILPRLAEQRTRVPLLRIIGDMGPRGVARLIKLTDDPVLAPAAAEALSLIARPDSATQIPGLTACVNNRPELRDSCGRALVRVSGPRCVPYVAVIRESARKADPLVRTYALLSLARIGPAAGRALPEALRAVGDPAPSVRAAAARALGAFGRSTPEVRSALKSAAADSDGEVSLAGKNALQALPKERPAAARQGGKT